MENSTRRSFDWIDITVYVVPVDENPSIPANIPADTTLETGVKSLLAAEDDALGADNYCRSTTHQRYRVPAPRPQ